jgi:hypothetical protein
MEQRRILIGSEARSDTPHRPRLWPRVNPLIYSCIPSERWNLSASRTDVEEGYRGYEFLTYELELCAQPVPRFRSFELGICRAQKFQVTPAPV